jgi:uncharacterized protein (TIGR03790 family)
LVLLAAALAPTGCQHEARDETLRTGAAASSSRPEAARRVLVVSNAQDPSSERIGAYYAKRRHIPDDHRLSVSVSRENEVSLEDYRAGIEGPVREHLRRRGLADEVDFIVLIRGVPLRIREGGYSVDAFLAAMDLELEPIRDRNPESFARPTNPYFARNVAFRKRDFGFYLVTRLDGYTPEDAMRLVDASLASRPHRGVFLFDIDPRYKSADYARINGSMRAAARVLRAKGLNVTLEDTKAFVGGEPSLAGYYSWGSNDGSYLLEAYRSHRFLPGAIAETAVSTSARTFARVEGGQSLIADLISAGVTGVKGYVSEPLAIALSPADLLFDRYTSGFTLAESFYMATPFLKWKDVVVGDPLCAPYKEGM